MAKTEKLEIRLIELNEGRKKELVSGNLKEIVTWLADNPDEYNWQLDEDSNAVMPNLSDVETIDDLRNELSKVDLSWWTLVIEYGGMYEQHVQPDMPSMR